MFTNPTEPETTGYYEKLMAALRLKSEEPRRVYWYLKRRDVAKFEPASDKQIQTSIALGQASQRFFKLVSPATP